jgi:hypothetical protein
VPDLGAGVERDQDKPARPQHPEHLDKGTTQLAGRQVDDRVERDHRRELPGRGRQREEIPFPEVHLRIGPAADSDHARRKINTDHRRAAAGKPGRNVPRATAQIGDRGVLAQLLKQAGEQGTVERLAGKFAAEAGHIPLSHRVVAAADAVMAAGSVHSEQALHPVGRCCQGTAVPRQPAQPGAAGGTISQAPRRAQTFADNPGRLSRSVTALSRLDTREPPFGMASLT